MSLLARTCRTDGKLLKPGYPAVPLKSVLARRARGEWTSGVGEANVAYTVLESSQVKPDKVKSMAESSQVFATIVAMDLPSRIVLTAADLG